MAEAQNCLLPMGVTSENVAHRFNVTRQEQDQAAVVFQNFDSRFGPMFIFSLNND